MKLLPVTGACAVTLIAATPALAQTVSEPPYSSAEASAEASASLPPPSSQGGAGERDALFGNWAGIRPRLEEAGVDLSISYKGEFAANVSGGERHDATEVGQVAFGGTLDMEKIAGIRGGTLQATITYRHGPDLGARAGLDVAQQVQEVYGRGQTWRLTEVSYQQVLAGGDVVFKLGRMPAGEFNLADCEFQNLTWCGAPAGNITGSYWLNYPVAQWTGWLKVTSGEVSLKLGVNEDNLNNLDNAFYLSRGGARGVILHMEAAWSPAFGSGRLPGYYKAGVWNTTAHDPDVLRDDLGEPFALSGRDPREVKGQYGVYVQGDQQLTGEATIDPISGAIARQRGLNAFFNVTRNDPATSTQLDQETLGFYYNGLFGRSHDALGVGLGRTGYNKRAALAQYLEDPAVGRRKAEYAAEVHYAFHAMPGLVLRPNVQYIVHPGGRRNLTDVVILGARIDANL